MLFTEIVRQQVVPFWEGSFDHPFITKLQAGTLEPEIFRYYLLQDCYYLKHFGQLYLEIAKVAGDPELKKFTLQCAENLALGEVAVRADFFAELGITEDEIAKTAIAPTAYHYVSHMYRQLVEGTPNVAFAGMLPCSWLYQEIGQHLSQKKSPVPIYQRWIDTYSGSEGAKEQQKVGNLINRLYAASDTREQNQMIDAFRISSQMEYSFWEMAYNLEKWPEGATTYVTN